MKGRALRLKTLLAVQEQLKTMHEMRHAGHMAAALSAEAEATELMTRFDAQGSLSGLFPELYHRAVVAARARSAEHARHAADEAERVALASARLRLIERDWRDAQRAEDRAAENLERLERIESRRTSQR